MIKKGSNFFEQHVEKMVLIFMVLICFWLLVTRVFLSPNIVEYDKRKLSTDKIDDYVEKESRILETILGGEAIEISSYRSQSDDLQKHIKSAVNVNTNLDIPVPGLGKEQVVIKPYVLPEIGSVSNVNVDYMRAVAYFPTEDVNEERNYYNVQHEPNDLDLVTVQAEFDVNSLFKRFYESFAGKSVREEWREPNLGKPVFAAVDLQRQELLPDGTWSDWEDIQRLEIDHNREKFKVPEKVEQLLFESITLKKQEIDGIQKELLQPICYEIASANEKWYPPLLHKQFVEKVKSVTEQKRREQKAAEAALREEQARRAREERAATSVESRTTETGTTGGRLGTVPAPAEARTVRTERRPEVQPPTTPAMPSDVNITLLQIFADVDSEIATEFQKIVIGSNTKISDLNEPLVFWAFDDTLQPEKSYRYRIRVGVFNPVAGTDNISKGDEGKKNDVVLWSEFSEVTDVITTLGKSYFFPLRIQDISKSVTIQVSKYAMGRWYSKDFIVQPGETIGNSVADNQSVMTADGNTIPVYIDFSTNSVMVDAVLVYNWLVSRVMIPRYYHDILYTADDIQIKKIACDQSFWSRDLTEKYNEIRKLQSEPEIPLRPFSPGQIPEGISPTRPIMTTPGQYDTGDNRVEQRM